MGGINQSALVRCSSHFGAQVDHSEVSRFLPSNMPPHVTAHGRLWGVYPASTITKSGTRSISMAIPLCGHPRRYGEQGSQSIPQGANVTAPEMKHFYPILILERAVLSETRNLAEPSFQSDADMHRSEQLLAIDMILVNEFKLESQGRSKGRVNDVFRGHVSTFGWPQTQHDGLCVAWYRPTTPSERAIVVTCRRDRSPM